MNKQLIWLSDYWPQLTCIVLVLMLASCLISEQDISKKEVDTRGVVIERIVGALERIDTRLWQIERHLRVFESTEVTIVEPKSEVKK